MANSPGRGHNLTEANDRVCHRRDVTGASMLAQRLRPAAIGQALVQSPVIVTRMTPLSGLLIYQVPPVLNAKTG